MLKIIENDIDSLIKSLPESYKVLDVGCASGPLKRADFLIDIVPFEDIYWGNAKGPGDIRASKNTYIQHDICSREPWPFKDKQFDYSFCSHVLEDIRDPLWACSELIRISKAGYIEVPSKLYETTFGVEYKNLAGAAHHRWVVDVVDDRLRFTFKYMNIHQKLLNKNRRKYSANDPEMFLCIAWSESFNYFENWLNSGKEIFEYYLNRPVTDKEKWRIYRKTSVKNLLFRWLSYFKNISPLINKGVSKFKK
jgi:SAM-dependent methyltransferase